MDEATTCRSCFAKILWARTAASGSLMPLDADPVPGGNVVIKDGLAHVVRVELFAVDGERYQSHYATCPEAKKWRKKK